MVLPRPVQRPFSTSHLELHRHGIQVQISIRRGTRKLAGVGGLRQQNIRFLLACPPWYKGRWRRHPTDLVVPSRPLAGTLTDVVPKCRRQRTTGPDHPLQCLLAIPLPHRAVLRDKGSCSRVLIHRVVRVHLQSHAHQSSFQHRLHPS